MKKIKPIFGRLTGNFGNDSTQLLLKVRKESESMLERRFIKLPLEYGCFNSESLFF